MTFTTSRLAIPLLLLLPLLLPHRCYSQREALQQARALEAPPAIQTSHGETEGAEFWQQNSKLLQEAWAEYESLMNEKSNKSLDLYQLMNITFQQKLQSAWEDPLNHETALRESWKPVAPAVFATQLFDTKQLYLLKEYFAAIDTAGIPKRRPNAMNRFGIILEPSVDGAVTLQGLTKFYQDLVKTVVRPVGRMLFPEYFSPGEANDNKSYAFTIRYSPLLDVSLQEHTDASLITLNVNLGVSSSTTDASKDDIFFVDSNGTRHNVTFTPGMAVVHLGLTPHGSYSVEVGERTNMVVWLWGDRNNDDYVRVMPYDLEQQMSIQERWAKGKGINEVEGQMPQYHRSMNLNQEL